METNQDESRQNREALREAWGGLENLLGGEGDSSDHGAEEVCRLLPVEKESGLVF